MQPFKSVANSYPINGTAWTTETYVHVRWGWLVFLGVQIFLSILLLAFTIVATQVSGTMVLKSSPLAVLFALGQDSRAVLGDVRTESEMKRRAATFDAALVGNQLVINR